jgi:hypothetical protein
MAAPSCFASKCLQCDKDRRALVLQPFVQLLMHTLDAHPMLACLCSTCMKRSSTAT